MKTLTDKEKMEKLVSISSYIHDNKDDRGFLSDSALDHVKNELLEVNECNESWCDLCKVKEELGCLCSDLFRIAVKGNTNG